MNPTDPIAAASSPDPYPYYAELVARTPFYRDERLGLTVASSAAAVSAVLSDERCLVRPEDEPVPRHLLGSPLAGIFGALVRMNDGAGHCPLKRAVAASLDELDPERVSRRSREWAGRLIDTLRPLERPGQLAAFAFQLPVYVVAGLLGAPADLLPGLPAAVDDLAASLGPAGAGRVGPGALAASQLLAAFGRLLDDQADGLLGELARQSRMAGITDRQIALANGIGLLSQAYEATAGLIGNTLAALANHSAARAEVVTDHGLLDAAIQETLRYDPPVQNTRRWLAADALLCGHELRRGEAVLVLLAAANRDPAANPRPAEFDLLRAERRSFTFGLGAHACPAASLAPIIARAAIERLLAAGLNLDSLPPGGAYRRSANTRIPLWT